MRSPTRTGLWDNTLVLEEDEDGDDIDGLDSWGEPIWACYKGGPNAG